MSPSIARSIQGLPACARETGRSMQDALHPAGEARYPGSSALGLTPALSGEARRAGRRPGRRGSSVCSGLLGVLPPNRCSGTCSSQPHEDALFDIHHPLRLHIADRAWCGAYKLKRSRRCCLEETLHNGGYSKVVRAWILKMELSRPLINQSFGEGRIPHDVVRLATNCTGGVERRVGLRRGSAVAIVLERPHLIPRARRTPNTDVQRRGPRRPARRDGLRGLVRLQRHVRPGPHSL